VRLSLAGAATTGGPLDASSNPGRSGTPPATSSRKLSNAATITVVRSHRIDRPYSSAQASKSAGSLRLTGRFSCALM